MINREEFNKVFHNIYESLDFLLDDKANILLEINEINNSIKILECKLNEMKEKINLVKNEGTNEDLFSPNANIKKGNMLKELQAEKKKYQETLKYYQSEVKSKEERFVHIEKLLNNLEQIKSYDVDQEHDDNKTEYGIKILETQESERKRIARDLHDSTVQNLTNMMHKTELCTKLINLDPVRAKLELQVMINTIKSTIKDMRSIIYDLRPMSLDDLGLVATIQKYIREIRINHEIDIVLDVIHQEVNVLSVINLTLFRIVQEATNNAIKHGKANKIIIHLEYTNGYIYLTIEDNGIGFNHNGNIEPKSDIFSGYGLPMMKERVILLSGELKIVSMANEGTKIFVKVPQRTYKEDI